MKQFNKLMVLTDYTVASSVAAAHCYQLAGDTKSEVISLHGISSNEDTEWAEKKSTDQLRALTNFTEDIAFKVVASTENLFTGLNRWIEKEGIDLYFMATHGKKDLQFITGSNALKLIFNAQTAMVVVQQHTRIEPYHHIVMPVFQEHAEMNFPVETLMNIAAAYSSKITLLVANKASTLAAIKRLQHVLADSATEISVVEIGTQVKKWDKEVMQHAMATQANAIALVVAARHHREEAEKQKKMIQALITNEQGLPVICL